MALLSKELRYRLFLFPCFLGILLSFVFFSRSAPGLLVLYIELIFTCVPIALCCLLYNNNDEIELVVSSRIPTYQCFGAKILSIYIISILSVFLLMMGIAIFSKVVFISALLVTASFIVTALFFLAWAVFFRLILKSAYISLPIMLVMVIVLALNHDAIKKGFRPDIFIYFDPYISDQCLGGHAWLLNRILMVAAAAIPLVIGFILLKKEKLDNMN